MQNNLAEKEEELEVVAADEEQQRKMLSKHPKMTLPPSKRPSPMS